MIRTTYIAGLFSLAVGVTCIGLVNLWENLEWSGPVTQRNWVRIRVAGGSLHLVHAHNSDAARPFAGATLLRGSLGVLGFHTGSGRGWRWVSCSLPLWVLVAVLFAVPAVAYVYGPLRSRVRRKRNECPACGYSLSGNTSGRCPECGKVAEDARLSAV